MSKILGLFAALAILLYSAAPSFAGKKALSEGDLDRITAAGEPTIVQVSGVVIEATGIITTDGTIGAETMNGGNAELSVSYEDNENAELTLGDDAQNNLRALVLNNVIGENQIGNGINILSGTSSSSTGQNGQNNHITQSWGAVKVTGVTTVTLSDSESTSAEADVTQNQSSDDDPTFEDKCVGFSCNVGDVNQTQGDATASTSAAATTVALAIAFPEYMSADVIVHVEDVEMAAEGGDAEMTVSVSKGGEASLSLGTGAQNTLAALVVNNVAGKNQVANGINITGGSIRLASPMDITAGGSNMTAGQSNTIAQYRGTPINAPQPVAIGIGAAAAAGNGGADASFGAIGIAGSQLQIVTLP